MKMNWSEIVGRLKNPKILMVLAIMLYEGFLKNHFDLKLEDYQNYVDLVCYLIIGAGIYHPFPMKNGGNGE